MNTLNKITFGIISASLIVVSFIGYEVYAQTSGQTKLSPVLYEVAANQGQSKTVEIAITNDSDQNITYDLSIVDFKPLKNGQPQMLFEDEQNPNYSLKDWFGELDKSISVPAQSVGRVQLPYSVPQDALNQTYYGSVIIRPVSEDNTADTLSPSLGTLLFVNVGSSNTKMSPEIKFDATEQTQGGIVTGYTFSVEVYNRGSYKITPRVYLEVLNPTGEVINTLEISASGSVLPDSSRIYSKTISGDTIDFSQPWRFNPVVKTENITVNSYENKKLYKPEAIDVPVQKVDEDSLRSNSTSVYVFYSLAAFAILSTAINVAVVFIKK